MTGSIGSPAGQTVLVIDDDASLRGLYAAALGRAGFEVLVAPDGETGLALVGSQHVGMVLCDVSMPGMSGFEVVRTLRATPETATMPIILFTGSQEGDSVLEGLAAGADDFLAKPIRLDELVARVRAHIRTQSAWLDVVQEQLRARVAVAATLAGLETSADPVAAARAIISELAERTKVPFLAVFQVSPDGRGRILASNLSGADELDSDPSPRRMHYLIDRARAGPWTEDIVEPEPGEPVNAFWKAGLTVAANAPILSGEELVGILTMASRPPESGRIGPRARDLALATVIDYAAVLGAVIGSKLSAQAQSLEARERLQRILDRRQFSVAFQPIVDLESRVVVGYEALTRFDDGVTPDRRFAEAFASGLGAEFELATLRLAADHARRLRPDTFIAFNISPDIVVLEADRLRELLPTDRHVVLELTEHIPVADYRSLREAIASLEGVSLSVDDAGAGFASMRHIVELQPAFAKLDISLVSGIHRDDLRQSLVAGLVYYAVRSGTRLIAEGVEVRDEADLLQALGVDMGQGYLFGRPISLEG